MADEQEYVRPVFARVYTDFFKRDAQIYALGDIRFNKPKSIKTVGYTLALLFIWAFPVSMIIGFERVFSNVVFAAIAIGPPIALGMVMGKPLFHNKPLVKDLKSIIKYTKDAPVYTDLQEFEYDDVSEITAEGSAWIADADCYDEDEEPKKKKSLFSKRE